MRPNTLVLLTLVCLALSCSGSGKGNPVAPSPGTESRVLALYTMTLSPAVTVSGQGHTAQDDHDVHLDLVPKGSTFPIEVWFFELDATLVDFDRGANFFTVDFKVTNKTIFTIYDPRLVFYFDYYDDTNGIYNEPGDPYQLSTADLAVM